MALDIGEYKCEFCGKQAKHVLFACFVCDSDECIDAAREQRGGPGGHVKLRKEGKSFDPGSIISADKIE